MPIRMKRFLSKHAHLLLTLVFGVAVFLFWRFRYPFVLSYQEQLQMFLFDGDYFCERMSEPGGLARYLAEFLVQFYNGVTIGAVIIALLLMLVQRLTWRLMFSASHYALSFIPVTMLWYAIITTIQHAEFYVVTKFVEYVIHHMPSASFIMIE